MTKYLNGLKINKQTSVDYTETKLLLGQNLVSQQSLSSPTSVVDIGNLNPISIVSDLSEGSLNFNDYSNNIDVESAGSYAYFLDRNGGSDKLGYNYQELAGVDAKDGLVLFNLQVGTHFSQYSLHLHYLLFH